MDKYVELPEDIVEDLADGVIFLQGNAYRKYNESEGHPVVLFQELREPPSGESFLGEIDPEEPLFGDGLGLDSIDALELALAITQKYDIQLKAEDANTHKAFGTLQTLNAYQAGHVRGTYSVGVSDHLALFARGRVDALHNSRPWSLTEWQAGLDLGIRGTL